MSVALRRIAFDEIDSTNSEAQRRIAAGDLTGPALITAARQSAGRGRLGRSWTSPSGNFHGSFVVAKDGRADWRRPWLLGAVAALAVAEAVSSLIEDGSDVRIKWPNDVTIGGAKVSGLLLEGSGASPFVVLGIGLNVAFAPTDTPYRATAIDRHRQSPVGLEHVTEQLSAGVTRQIERWLDQGFAALRPSYLARTHRVGEALSVQIGETRVAGRFLDLDSDGFLIIEVDGKPQRVSAGDVLPRPGA